MNKYVSELHAIGSKKERYIIGLMSGTSLDGLDIALCKFEGTGMETGIKLIHFTTVPYDTAFKEEIKSVFSKRSVDLEKVCLLNGWVAIQHADMILRSLKQWSVSADSVDLIASHGQTIYHAPKLLHGHSKFGNGTLQIGDGDHMAFRTGIITISDFRQKHIAAGGEGAPLAAYGDYLIFSSKYENRIMLNIGGIANFTYLPATLDNQTVFCTDTGTGNTLMDQYIQANFPGKHFDENANIASKGMVNYPLLTALLDNPFFKAGFPKTIGPELFNLTYLDEAKSKANIGDLSHEDVLATLNEFSAKSISDALQPLLSNKEQCTVYVSGGGMHNPLLLKNIKKYLTTSILFKDTLDLGIHPDAKEAVLFAVLANECISGGEAGPGNAKQGIPSVSMGKISLPR